MSTRQVASTPTTGDTSMSDGTSPPVPSWLERPALPGRARFPAPSVEAEVVFGAPSQRGPLRPVNDDHYLVLRLGSIQETLLRASLKVTRLRASMASQVTGRLSPMVWAPPVKQPAGLPSRRSCSWRSTSAGGTSGSMSRSPRRWSIASSGSIEPSTRRSWRRATTAFAVYQTTLYRRLHLAGSEAFVAHVGHSRAYVFRDGQLMQLTHDHTVERRRSGTPMMDVATSARDAHHIVTDTLGGPGPGTPERKSTSERAARASFTATSPHYLLCTNGLTDVADEAHRSAGRASTTHLARRSMPRRLRGTGGELGAPKNYVTAVIGHYRIKTSSRGAPCAPRT